MKIYTKLQNWYKNLWIIKKTLYSSLIIPLYFFIPAFIEIIILVVSRIIESGFEDAFLWTYKLCSKRCGEHLLQNYIYFKHFYAWYLIIQSFIFWLFIFWTWNIIWNFLKKRKEKAKITKIRV